MDGIAATQEIREIEQKEKRKRLPIIAVTARAMFGDKERILENKLDDYIAKRTISSRKLGQRTLCLCSFFVERQVKEVAMIQRGVVVRASGARFATSCSSP